MVVALDRAAAPGEVLDAAGRRTETRHKNGDGPRILISIKQNNSQPRDSALDVGDFDVPRSGVGARPRGNGEGGCTAGSSLEIHCENNEKFSSSGAGSIIIVGTQFNLTTSRQTNIDR